MPNFLLITGNVAALWTGVLNIIGGAYCLKAKAAIQAMQANPASVPAAVAVPVAAVAVPVGPNKA